MLDAMEGASHPPGDGRDPSAALEEAEYPALRDPRRMANVGGRLGFHSRAQLLLALGFVVSDPSARL